MTPTKLQQLLRRTPFDPFRVHLCNGQRFDVPHPDFAALSRRYLVVFTDPDDEGLPTRSQEIDPLHITHVETHVAFPIDS